MSTTQVSSETTTAEPGATPVPLRLEVVTLPVSDVERAKGFYQRLGWRLDADISAGDDFRVVQFTPPQSQTSIHFGVGLTNAEPGSVARLYLAVDDVEEARADLISRGADVSEVFHYDRGPGHSGEFDSRVPGPDTANGGSYSTYASFDDPDGNGWLLQQITGRLPGRVWEH
jgi:catechol 2,3-dioxygenase-like lactoylglutathione lyase family enzyme